MHLCEVAVLLMHLRHCRCIPSIQGIHSCFNNTILLTTILLHSWKEVGCNSDIIGPENEGRNYWCIVWINSSRFSIYVAHPNHGFDLKLII